MEILIKTFCYHNRFKNTSISKRGVKAMLENYKDVLSVYDLYEILPLGKTSIYNLLNTNAIKNIRVGSRIIIPKQCLIDYLKTAC